MKTLYLVRHAKAVSRESDIADFERPLMKRGEKDAKKMAARLQTAGAEPQYFLSSPAPRALQTAKIFAKKFAYPKKKIDTHPAIYEQTTGDPGQELLELIRKTGDRYNSLIVFGHDPVLTDLAHYLSADFGHRLPTCAVVQLEFSGSSWSEIDPGGGRVVYFDYPRKRKEYWNTVQADVAMKVESQLQQALARINPDSGEEWAEKISKISAGCAKKFVKALKRAGTPTPTDGRYQQKPASSGATVKRGKPVPAVGAKSRAKSKAKTGKNAAGSSKPKTTRAKTSKPGTGAS